MARAGLSLQTISRSGLNATYAAAEADGNSFPNTDERNFVHIKNGSAAERTITVLVPRTVDGLDVEDLTVAIPTSEERIIGPFPKSTFNQSDGAVYVDYDDEADVTVAAIKLGT